MKKMTYEYIAELRNFLYLSKNCDEKVLKNKVADHLNYIPYKKLYRFRQCNRRELLTIRKNSIWLAKPKDFPDLFDARIPMPDRNNLYYDYPFLFSLKASYRALVETSEYGEILPTEDEFQKSIYDIMQKYKPDEIETKCIELFGDQKSKLINENVNSLMDLHIEKLIDFFNKFTTSPRYTLAVASFTTNYDNRYMWENYADSYSGFCENIIFLKL